MAARSIFVALTRNCRTQRTPFRFLSSSSAPASEALTEESRLPREEEERRDENGVEYGDDLKSRIMRVRLPKRSATNALQKWVSEGRKISISDLRDISKALRRSRRYKHALEVSEWMVGHEEYELLDSDYATRIDLMTKVFGIDAAERYFEGLPPTAKTCETYTAMLHCYAGSKQIEKAEALYQRAKDSNLSLSALTYNEMMTLYMSVGQVEKVPSVIEELKRQKVDPDLFTYNLWISSFAATMDIDRVKNILNEMGENSGSDQGWVRYLTLANLYLKSGHFANGGSSSLVESEKSISQREWITYDFLMILYAGLGNRNKLDQIWKSLVMTKQKMTSRNYVCIISSYLVLGDMKEVGGVIDQWKESTALEFDMFACNRLIKALLDHGLTDKAEAFRMLLSDKGCDSL